MCRMTLEDTIETYNYFIKVAGAMELAYICLVRYSDTAKQYGSSRALNGVVSEEGSGRKNTDYKFEAVKVGGVESGTGSAVGNLSVDADRIGVLRIRDDFATVLDIE